MADYSDSRPSALMGDEVHVLDPSTGQRCRMVLKKGVGAVSVAKLKANLAQHFQIAPEDQLLLFEGRELLDHMVGAEAGLRNGSVLHVQHFRAAPPPQSSMAPLHHSHPQPAYHPLPAPSRRDSGAASHVSDGSLEHYRHCRCCNCRRPPSPSSRPLHQSFRPPDRGSMRHGQHDEEGSVRTGAGGDGGDGGAELSLAALHKQLQQAARGPDATKVQQEQAKLSQLQDAYVDLVKRQQWVMEAGPSHSQTQSRLSHEAAYKAGTAHIGGMGVAELRTHPVYY